MHCSAGRRFLHPAEACFEQIDKGSSVTLRLLVKCADLRKNVFSALHYYSFDVILMHENPFQGLCISKNVSQIMCKHA